MARTPTHRGAIAIAAALFAAILPGCLMIHAGHPYPGPGAWARPGVWTGEDFLGRHDARLEQLPGGTALLTIAPGPNPLPQDAGPHPAANVHRGRWYSETRDDGMPGAWVVEVDSWPRLHLQRNWYWTRYETHAWRAEPVEPPSACNDWGRVFALVSDDPARR